MKSVGAYEAKTHLSRILEEVEAGETITITKHGREVARLIPVARRGTTSEVVAAVRAARHGVQYGPGSVREAIQEGRR